MERIIEVINKTDIANEELSNVVMVHLDDLPINIKSDITNYCKLNNKESQLKDGYMRYDTALHFYLSYNEVFGCTNNIIALLKTTFNASITLPNLNNKNKNNNK